MSIYVSNGAQVKLDLIGEVNIDSNGIFGMYSWVDGNTILEINVETDASLNLDQNGVDGFRAAVLTGAELNVTVKEGGAFKSCENTVDDIRGSVSAYATAKVLGDGSYICDQTKVELVCLTALLTSPSAKLVLQLDFSESFLQSPSPMS